MKFIALKAKDGGITGEIAFCCRVLKVSRQGKLTEEELNRVQEENNNYHEGLCTIEEQYQAWEKEKGNGNDIGVVTISEDDKTLTATYTVNSFSPFTVYVFIEADEPEVKTITSNTTPATPSYGTNSQSGHSTDRSSLPY